MKALFCYDGPMYKDENGNYYDSILDDRMFERYFKVADKLKLVIRTRDTEASQAAKRMSRLSDPNITVCECPDLSSVTGLIAGTKAAKEILCREISEADLIFIRLPSVIGNLSVDLCRKQKKQYLIEVVGCPWDSYWNYSVKGKIVAPAAAQMMRSRVKKAPFVLYVTNRFLQSRYPTRGKSVSCSNVELIEMEESVLQRRLRKIESYTSDSVLTIGTAAGLDVPYKGQQFVIEAMGKLKKQGITQFRYSVIGGGTGDRLRRVAKANDVEDQVDIVGQLPHGEVFGWLDSIDIYAQPSRQEGLPRSVIEAMSRGIPCIGARTAGIPELLSDACIFSNGKNEIEEICTCLLHMRDQETAKAMAKLNFREAKNYQRDLLAERRTRFFREYAGKV